MTTTDDGVTEALVGILAAELKRPADGISPAAGLADLGLSSVKVLRVIAEVERRYEVALPDEQVFGCDTVEDLAQLVRAQRTP